MLQDKFRTGRSPQGMETFTLPSMVEPCFNPSIEEMLRNPSCLLVSQQGFYDEDPYSEDPSDDYIPDRWNQDVQPLFDEVRKSRSKAKPKTEHNKDVSESEHRSETMEEPEEANADA